jgi:PhnB protein
MAKKSPKRTAARRSKATTARTARTARGSSRRGSPGRANNGGAPPALVPYLAVNDAAGAIDWYKDVFGAKEVSRQASPDGKVWHAQLQIEGSLLYLSDIFPQSDLSDPTRSGPSVNLWIFSRNLDKMWQKATNAGAKVTTPIDDMFWGQRMGRLIDPFGHSWSLTYRSKLSKAELAKKQEAAMRDFASSG